MTKADYEGVCQNMRLAGSLIWPIPITLDVTEDFAINLTAGSSKVALRDAEGVMLAVLHVEEVWQPDRTAEAKATCPTTRSSRPIAVLNISGTELRKRLNEGRDIPGWFTYPEVVDELRRRFQPRSQQGVTIFFIGLSGSGESTIAKALLIKFLEVGGRPVTLLDGDLVRKHLSSELGFSKEHRDINIRCIGSGLAEAVCDWDHSPAIDPRGVGNYQDLRDCDLCAHRSLRCHSQARAPNG
jgi:hypothetical protein